MWKIDPKDKPIHKYNHNHKHTHIYERERERNNFSSSQSASEDQGEEQEEMGMIENEQYCLNEQYLHLCRKKAQGNRHTESC
jgi:hypothetical protein